MREPNQRLDQYLQSTVAMGGAAVLAAGFTLAVPQSEAAVIITSVGVTWSEPASGIGGHILFDIDTGATLYIVGDGTSQSVVLGSYPSYEFAMSWTAAAGGILYIGPSSAAGPNTLGPAGVDTYELSVGYYVGPTSPAWTSSSGFDYLYGLGGTWTPGTSGFVGGKIDDGTGAYNFFWIYVTLVDVDTATVISWGVETTTGLGLTTVPEPSSWALAGLALGAVGVGAWRRRRDEDVEAA